MKEWQPNSEEMREALDRVQVVIVYPQLGPELLVLDLRKRPGSQQITILRKKDVLPTEQIHELDSAIPAQKSISVDVNLELRNKVLHTLEPEDIENPPAVFSNYVASLADQSTWAGIISLFSPRISIESLQCEAGRIYTEATKRDLFRGTRETGGFWTIWQRPRKSV